jgi:hypothetical protein
MWKVNIFYSHAHIKLDIVKNKELQMTYKRNTKRCQNELV